MTHFQVFCNAKSCLDIPGEDVLDLLVDKGMGFGQVFSHLHRLPVFTLIACGKSSEVLWRKYKLEITGMTCTILEVFPADLFHTDYLTATKNFTKEVWEKVQTTTN